jgi:hypothetical protein
MAQSPEPRSSLGDTLRDAGVETRHRELAVEHLLFHTLMYVEKAHPGLLDHLEGSLDHLGDHASDETKDDEAVREVARTFLASLRRNG